MTNMSMRNPSPAKRGFSLIEILIAIIILALGLLGLGALFPVVVRQQRISSDQTLGVIVLQQAKAKLTLTGTSEIAEGTQYGRSAWESLFNSNEWESNDLEQRYGTISRDRPLGEWWVGTVLDRDLTVSRGEIRGASIIGTPGVPNDARTIIPLAERLYPVESSTPLLVWDFAVQATPGGAQGKTSLTPFAPSFVVQNPPITGTIYYYPINKPSMRAAIFVRRIDQRIRTDAGISLRETLLGGANVAPAQQKSPLGVNADGLPTLDGTDGETTPGWAYANLLTSRVCFVYSTTPRDVHNKRDRLYVPPYTGTGTDPYTFMSQPGQKLVDNLGNIYTVTGSGEADTYGRYVTVTPTISNVVSADKAAPGVNANPTQQESIREVVFSPQVPVGVSVVEVSK